MAAAPDFGRLAADYDRVRPVDANWQEVFALVVEEADLRGRRVLDCGCGTGRLSAALVDAAGARVSAIDPEPRMLAVARERLPASVELEQAGAEHVPFRAGRFERAVLWLVCHLIDRPPAFRELRRVLAPAGRLAIVTFDPAHFDGFWLNRLFPSLEAVDRARFPAPEELERELSASGFTSVRRFRLSQHVALTRDEALERIRSRHISTFDLLDPDEVRSGTERAMEELPATVEYALEWLIAVAQR